MGILVTIRSEDIVALGLTGLPAAVSRPCSRVRAVTDGKGSDSDSLSDVQEVAELARCEHRSVRRAINAGRLRAFRPTRKILVREDDARSWIESRRAVGLAARPQRRRPARPQARQWVVSPACRRSKGDPGEHSANAVRSTRSGGRRAAASARGAFERAGDAEAFELEAKRRRPRSTSVWRDPVPPDASRVRRAGLVAAVRDPQSRTRYPPTVFGDLGHASVPRVGGLRVREITPLVVEDMIAAMVRARRPGAYPAQGRDAASRHVAPCGRARSDPRKPGAAGRQAQADLDRSP